MNLRKLIRQIFILLIFLPSLIFANVIRVPEDYPTIQLALNYASSNDTVLVKPGTYRENIIWPNVNSIKLISTGNSDNTIISGEKKGIVINFPQEYLIDSTTTINGFTIKDGLNNNIYPDAAGGGIRGFQANPKLENLLFINNQSNDRAWGGGALFLYGGNKQRSTVLRNIEVRQNYAQFGSGIYIHSLDYLIMENILLVDNQGTDLYIVDSDSKSWIIDNLQIIREEFRSGTGIYIQSNDSLALDGILIQNLSTGISIWGCSGQISNCSIINNNVGIWYHSGYNNLDIKNCTFSGNQSGIQIEAADFSPRISHSNFSNNIFGVYSYNTQTYTNSETNWWGHHSGPNHETSNPDGLGDPVNLYVDVIPFNTSPDTLAPPLLVQNLSIDTIGVDFVRLKWNSSPIGDLAGYKLYINENPTIYTFSDTIDVGNDTVFTLNNLITGSTYYVSVTCYDNSGDESWFVKTLPVMSSPISIINTESDKIDFGTVLVGDKAQKSLVIHNIGTADLNISNITTTSSEFVSLDTTLTILSGNQKEIAIVYHPANFGVDTAKAIIFSDAYNYSEYTISLIGFGDLSPSPEISSIVDVTDDQGGSVRISFLRSKYDGIDSTYKVVSYTIWRLIEDNIWDAVGMFNAVQDSFYNFVSPTLGDSTIHGIVWSTFKVSAHTENPDIFFYSDSLSGYSIDNIAPGVPEGLLAKESNDKILLTWQLNKEKDFQYYGIYRSTCSNFDPDTMEIYTFATSDTFLYDSDIEGNINYFYRVSAFDFSGNESEYSPEVSAVVVGLQTNNESVPIEYSLSQNYPNPFNPTTTISYQLPKSSFVKLSIYDINGRLVETLVNEHKNAGYYSVNWNSYNVSSGIYIYRIDTGEFSCMKKCIVVK